MASVGFGPYGILVDTANACAARDADLHVALVAPAGSPRVADKGVVLAVLSAVADSSDTMIEVSSAGRSGDHTFCVVLEGGPVSLDSD